MAGGRPATDEQFSDFVRAHTAALLRTGYLLTRDAGEAEELVQDTLVWLYPRWPQVQAAEHQLAYVRKALVNRFLAGRRRRSATELRLDPIRLELPGHPGEPDRTAEVDQRLALWRALEQLSSRQRTAVVLRFFHDLPDEQIARTLGCRVGTVRSLISRSLAVLRGSGGVADDPADPSRLGGLP